MKSLQLVYLLMLVFVFACASGHQETSKRIRTLAAAGDYAGAIGHLKESDLAREERSKLLYLTELGLLEHYRGHYAESVNVLTEAKAIIDELFTTRVSGKVASFISNDNADLYYGEKYEASLIYFYLALNQYTMSLQETDAAKKKELLHKARAEVVAWDSFLTEMKEERLGKALYKEDLLAKVFGGFIHESQNTNQDDQIALQLYKDAQGIFFRNYNLYPTFNQSYEDFKKNFTLFPEMNVKEIEGKYVLATDHNKDLQDFLKQKISFMMKKLKKSPKSKDGTITFVVQDGMIAEKVPQKYELPMAWGVHETMALSMSAGSKITFELPILHRQDLKTSYLQAWNKEGKMIQEVPLTIVAPLSDMAEQAIKEHSAAIAAKTATRVATKHIAALLASSVTYQSAKQNNNSLLMLMALAGHATSVAAINASEKADVRYWSTLPSSIRMGQIALPAGAYSFKVAYGKEASLALELGSYEVTANSNLFVSNRSNSNPSTPDQPGTSPIAYRAIPASCMKNSDCLDGKVCAPIKGEFPGSCSGTGLFGLKLNSEKSHATCMSNADCSEGKTCATVKGEYPGSCAYTGLFGGMRHTAGNTVLSCMSDADCSGGKVCATIKGEYPGSCAER